MLGLILAGGCDVSFVMAAVGFKSDVRVLTRRGAWLLCLYIVVFVVFLAVQWYIFGISVAGFAGGKSVWS